MPDPGEQQGYRIWNFNRVSEARFPTETLKQRAAGGHQSSWFELIPPLREKNRRRSRIARDCPINAHDRFARFNWQAFCAKGQQI
ncbi:MAG TPA: hypothetical protein VK561_17535 [Bradyrhizobium sp.]|nr:hypothetical protein [Bradyrhizobium sp.]